DGADFGTEPRQGGRLDLSVLRSPAFARLPVLLSVRPSPVGAGAGFPGAAGTAGAAGEQRSPDIGGAAGDGGAAADHWGAGEFLSRRGHRRPKGNGVPGNGKAI